MLTKRLLQVAITIAVIAFILSFSRMFLTIGERSSDISDFYVYNLSESGTLSAFIATMLISVIAIVVGIFLSKTLEIVGIPLIIGGAAVLIYTSIASYLFHSLSNESTGANGDATANIVLLIVFLLELGFLITYAELKLPNLSQTVAQPPASPAPPAAPLGDKV